MPPRKKTSLKSQKSGKNEKSFDLKKSNDCEDITESFKPIKTTTSLRTKETKKPIIRTVDIPKLQEILKDFDLNADYGPILGIPRTARYFRAKFFNLPVKDEVTQILTDHVLVEEFPELDLNIWHNIETLL